MKTSVCVFICSYGESFAPDQAIKVNQAARSKKTIMKFLCLFIEIMEIKKRRLSVFFYFYSIEIIEFLLFSSTLADKPAIFAAVNLQQLAVSLLQVQGI